MMNKDSIDTISKTLSIALDLLFMKNPQRTSLGVLLGVILQTATQIFLPILKQIEWIDISTTQWYQYWIIGLGLLYLPMIGRYIFIPGGLGEDIERALNIIKRAERAGLPKATIGKMYLDLSQTVLKNSTLKESFQKELSVPEEDQQVPKV